MADNSLAEPQKFEVTVKVVELQREPPPCRVFVSLGQTKFTFLTPDGFQVANNPAHQEVTMTSPSRSCIVAVRISRPAPEDQAPFDSSYFRKLLLSRHPNAKIINEFSRSVAGHEGPAFDLQWDSGGAVQGARVAFIQTPVGILEFSAVGSDNVHGNFNTVVSTFTASKPDGKLEILEGCDQT